MSTEECSAIPGEMQEEWRPVVGYEKYYSVSNLGRVKRIKDGTGNTKIGRILKVSQDKLGYGRVGLCVLGEKQKHLYVHRLVAESFIGTKPEGAEVNHKNGHKNDNRAHNLEWTTHTENIRHAFSALGKQNPRGEVWHKIHSKTIPKGRQCYCAKLTESQVLSILAMNQHSVNQSKLARQFSVTQTTIWSILNNKTWKHLPRKECSNEPRATG